MPSFAGRTVAIALSARDFALPNTHPAVVELGKLGCRSLRVRDGDPEGLNAELLILYGNCRAFHRYRRLLRDTRNRPKVAIWQIDPLPPVEFDRNLEKKALGLSAFLGHSRGIRPIEMMAGYPLYARIAKNGFGVYSDRTQGNLVDATMARTVVEAYAYIYHALREGWVDHVFPTTLGRQRFLESRGIESPAALPISLSKNSGQHLQLTRDIDVVFFGKLRKSHRRSRLATVTDALEKSGARVVVTDNCFGNARTRLLNRTKLVLHIHKYPWDTPWMRWGFASACGAAMISETLSDQRPLQAGVHYIEAAFDKLPATIEKALVDPESLRTMAHRCLLRLEEEASLARSVEAIVSHSFDGTTRTI